MKLSKRLQMNVSLVPQGARVADIGCDHGYAAIWLVETGTALRMIAMDINQGPLERAREHIRQNGLEEKIECRKSNGMEKLLPGEADTLMIAGMGGPLMLEILKAYPEVLAKVNTLVLQPQSEIGMVRDAMGELGFEIVREKACKEEGKFYFSMLALRRENFSEPRLYNVPGTNYSTYLIEQGDKTMLAFLEQEEKVYRAIYDQLQSKNMAGARKQEVKERCRLLGQLILKMNGKECQ